MQSGTFRLDGSATISFSKELNKEEIEFFVKGYTDGSIPDYQAAALVMAIYINGMTKEETTNLALAMAYSGDVFD